MEKTERVVFINWLPTPCTGDGVKELSILSDAGEETYRDPGSGYVSYESQSEQTAEDAV